MARKTKKTEDRPERYMGPTFECRHGPWDDRCEHCWDPKDPEVEQRALRILAERNKNWARQESRRTK